VTWTITPLLVARAWSPGPEVYHQREFGTGVDLGFYCWIVRGSQRTVLIDTGVPPDIEDVNAGIRSRKGPGSGFHILVYDLPAALRRMGVRLRGINAIVLTSLGIYAAGNVGRFPAARLYVSGRGWREYQHPRYPELRHPLPPRIEAALRAGRLTLVNGTSEPFAGLKIREVGAHHTSSMAVAAETQRGVIAIADPIFVRGNWTRSTAIGVAEDLRAYWRLVRWLRRRCDGVIPIHDLDPTPIPTRSIE
jgi:glyoxylase-like metal-dependent hydrolase (beta-lactamase superfamily II)